MEKETLSRILYYGELSPDSKQFIQNLVDKKDKEIKKLNKIIDKAIHYINLNQDSKSLCLNYEQLKALRGILKQDEFYLRLFEKQLKELKGDNKDEIINK